MSKFIILVVVASLVACISADDNDNFDSKAFNLFNPEKDIDGVKNLAKPIGGHVSGFAKTFSHKSETKNGVPVLDQTKTDEVANDDGHVSEKKTSY